MTESERLFSELVEVYQQKQDIEQREKDTRRKLLKIMKQKHQNSVSDGHITVKLVPGFNRTVIDKKALYKQFPAAVSCVRSVWVEDHLKVTES